MRRCRWVVPAMAVDCARAGWATRSVQAEGNRQMRRMIAPIMAGALMLLGAGGIAQAAEWPTKPVRVIVPFAPGGAADASIRRYSDALSTAFGKPFVIENRAGGAGIPAAEAVVRAEPDGYTLVVSGIPIVVLGPAMNKHVGYDPMRDLVHIAYFGGTPNVLVTHPSLGLKTYAEFLAYARRAAGGTDYVSAGFGTVGNWVAEYLAAAENIKLNHVAYKGGAQAILDLLAGHVRVAMLTWTSVAEHVRVGKLSALAVTSANRLPYLPELPTLQELGHHGFTSLGWYSLSGPAGLPRDIVNAINREVVKATQRPELKRLIELEAIEVSPMTPAELARFSQGEIERWGPLIRRIMATKEH
jgi:tripartite-type tricarboxylate transporter receptor subunit TctC